MSLSQPKSASEQPETAFLQFDPASEQLELQGGMFGGTDERMYGRTDRISSLCSTGHRPLSGPLPKRVCKGISDEERS